MNDKTIIYLFGSIICFYISLLLMFIGINFRISAIKQRLECMCCHLCNHASNEEEEENENNN